MTGANRKAVVVGGSIGGLFAASLLLRRGWDVEILERTAGGLQSRGTGVAMHPELDAILTAAGALPAGAIGVRVTGRTAFDRHGRELAHREQGQFLTAWSRVHQLLHAAFPAGRYHAGREVTAIDLAAGRPVVRCHDGTAITADLVVGADGIRSTVRALFAPKAVPRYAGYVGWRGMVDEARLSDRFRAETFHRFAFVFPGGSQFIGYPVAGADGSLEPGRRRYNFLWYYPVDEGASLTDLFTDEAGQHHEGAIPPQLIRQIHLDRIRRDAATRLPRAFAEAMAITPQLLLQAIHDVESPRLAFGPVALIGDAAFVARPHLGVGILKAAEDARALEESLDAEDAIPAGLARFEAARLGPGRGAVHASRHLGAFIERRLDAPWSDPHLGLTPARLLELSASPLTPQFAEQLLGDAA